MNDERRLDIVKAIKLLTEEFVDYCSNFGNQCAYTDDIARKITNWAEMLKEE